MLKTIYQIIRLFRKPRMKQGPSKIRPDNELIVEVPFRFIHETHDTASFQKEGRMLPTLRHRDWQGQPDFTPDGVRTWGPTVHILRLPNPSDPEHDVLSCKFDSLAGCMRSMQEQIPQLLYGTWTAQFCRDTQREELQALSDRAIEWIRRKHGDLAVAEVRTREVTL